MEKNMENCRTELIALPKRTWKGVLIPLKIRSQSYYDLEINPLDRNGCTVSLIRKQAEKEIVHTPEEYNFPDSLYQEHWEHAQAYGIVSECGDLLACIEICPEEWSNRLMVTELWVSDELRHQGIGKKRMDQVKLEALNSKLDGRRDYGKNQRFELLSKRRPDGYDCYGTGICGGLFHDNLTSWIFI